MLVLDFRSVNSCSGLRKHNGSKALSVSDLAAPSSWGYWLPSLYLPPLEVFSAHFFLGLSQVTWKVYTQVSEVNFPVWLKPKIFCHRLSSWPALLALISDAFEIEWILWKLPSHYFQHFILFSFSEAIVYLPSSYSSKSSLVEWFFFVFTNMY